LHTFALKLIVETLYIRNLIVCLYAYLLALCFACLLACTLVCLYVCLFVNSDIHLSSLMQY